MYNKFAELDLYKGLNKIAKSNCTVLFGTDRFKNIPVSELSAGFEMDIPIYNRSLKNANIDECENALKECIYELNPCKIFLNIGEVDIEAVDFNFESFITKYEWLLYSVHSNCKGKIYIVSVLSSNPKSVLLNKRLEEISDNSGCCFIDISSVENSTFPEIKIFDILKTFIRNREITMTEAFLTAGIIQKSPSVFSE